MKIGLGGGQAPAPLAGTQETSSFVPPPPVETDFALNDGTLFTLNDGTQFVLN